MRGRVLGLALLMFSPSIAQALPPADGGPWTVWVGKDIAANAAGVVASDAVGTPHVAASVPTGCATGCRFDVQYLTPSLGGVISETVTAGAFVLGMAFDPDGQPHMLLVSASGDDLLHSERNATGIWHTEPIGVNSNRAAFAVWQGKPTVVAINNTGGLILSQRGPQGWVARPIVPKGPLVVTPQVYTFSIATDPSGALHMIATVPSEGYIIYGALSSDGGYHYEIPISNGPDVSLRDTRDNLAFDSAGVPHFVCICFDRLVYVTRGPVVWTSTLVDAKPDREASLKFDARDHPVIAYALPAMPPPSPAGLVPPCSLAVARQQSGAWVTEQPDCQTALAGGITMALDAMGRPIIAYAVASANQVSPPGHQGALAVTAPASAWALAMLGD